MMSKKDFGPIFGRKRKSWKEEELVAAFKLSWDSPAVQGVLALVDEAIENAATQAGDPALSERPGALAHTCGGLEWLRYLRNDIERHGPNFRH
tara:strand:- start:4026 stop:4304 length:279 start_codon:yes stop_codon:yes gene_type:complete